MYSCGGAPFESTRSNAAPVGVVNSPEPGGLGLKTQSDHAYYDIDVRSDDGLAFIATARATRVSGQSDDTRCTEFSIDHNGIRRAHDAAGQHRSADCWH